MDDKRATSMASFAVRTPVVIFHPGNLTLVSGPATLRRTLLDRIALFLDPASGDARARYKKAQRERHMVLQKQPEHGTVLDAFERVMATNGALLQRARQAASEALSRSFADIDVETSVANGRLLAYLAAHGEIIERTYDGERVIVHVRIPQRHMGALHEKGTEFRPHRPQLRPIEEALPAVIEDVA